MTVSQPPPYNFGDLIRIQALPVDHYEFVSWTGTLNSSSPTIEASINNNLKLHANYTQSIYNLNIIPEIQNFLGTPTEIFDEEFGSISKGISSTYNTNISLNALPSARFEFLYWKDEEGQIISVQQDLQHTLVKSENIYGVFKEKAVEVNLANRPQSGGDIYINNVSTKTTSLNLLPFGVTQNFTPKPSNGYSFVHWEINNQISENQNIQFNGLDTLQLTAVYEPLPYPLEVIVYPEGSGQVLTQSSKNSFLNDSLVELTAVPNQGYKFSYWSGEVSQSINPKTSLIMKEGGKFMHILLKLLLTQM